MADRMTRFDADLFDAAAEEGRRENRSGRQQLEHWTRIGRLLAAYETATRRRIEDTVTGPLPLSALSADEQLIANVEIDVAIRERAAVTSFGHALLKSGVKAVALDDQGDLVEFGPDGSRRLVDAEPQPERRAPAG